MVDIVCSQHCYTRKKQYSIFLNIDHFQYHHVKALILADEDQILHHNHKRFRYLVRMDQLQGLKN